MNGKPVTKEECMSAAKKFNSRGDFYKTDKRCYNACSKYGWLDEACAHMTSGRRRWTEEAVREEAAKHSTRAEWRAASIVSYRKAVDLGIADECMAHMTGHRRSWTEEQLYEEALKHDSITSLKENGGGAYAAARRLGISMANLLPHTLDPERLIDSIENEVGAVRRARGVAHKVQAIGGVFCQETAWLYDQLAHEREDRLLCNIERLQAIGEADLVRQAWEKYHAHQVSWLGSHI